MNLLKAICFSILFIIPLPPLSGQASRNPGWQKISAGVLEARFGSITTVSVTPRIIFLDSRHSLYRTIDGGKNWTRIFKLTGSSNSEIHRIYSSPHHSSTVYLATSEGLYISRDWGGHFESLFTSSQKKERNCASLAFHPLDADMLFLGTSDGLFWTWDAGKTWKKELLHLANEEIIKIVLDPEEEGKLFILTPGKLYGLDEKKRAFKILFQISEPEQFPEPEEMFPEEVSRNRINDFEIIPYSTLLLATRKGLLESQDHGQSWNLFTEEGLRSRNITKILTAQDQLIFAASARGIYRYESSIRHWIELKEGLSHTDASDLAFHPAQGGVLFSVTSAGAFRIPLPIPLDIEGLRERNTDSQQMNSVKQYFTREPDIAGLREAAIRYNDLDPAKTRKWSRDSRVRHFLPKLSGGLRKVRDQIIDIDRGGTSQPDTFVRGPDEFSWSTDVSVSWELANFIWDDSQTSIDSRSKLMTELRNEILSDLTRLYFERRRLLAQYFLTTNAEPIAQLELIEKIRELTAHIDAYTGGFLTEELERKKAVYPWEKQETSK